MKKLIFCFLAIAFLTTSFIVYPSNSNDKINSNPITKQSDTACRYGQCHATAKSTGLRCRHCVSNEGDLYCWQH